MRQIGACSRRTIPPLFIFRLTESKPDQPVLLSTSCTLMAAMFSATRCKETMDNKIAIGRQRACAAPAVSGGNKADGIGKWGWSDGLVCCLFAGAAQAALDAVDDSYGVPFGAPLQVAAFGVVDNDLLDGRQLETPERWRCS